MRLPIQGTVLGAMFLGVQAAVIAVIVRAVHRIGEHILLDGWLWVTAGAVAAASLAGVSFWIVLPAAGAAYALAKARRLLLAASVVALAAALHAIIGSGGGLDGGVLGAAAGVQPTAMALFIAGLKGGLLTFGGAYTATRSCGTTRSGADG